jgi:WhiB family redox-sensing transcriptional regulator
VTDLRDQPADHEATRRNAMTRFRNQHTTRAAGAPPVAALEDRACAGINPEIFFSHDRIDEALALDLCDSCPHQHPCLEWALDTEQQFGIWGGATAEQRMRMIRGAA